MYRVSVQTASLNTRELRLQSVDFPTIRRGREKTRQTFPNLIPAFPQSPFLAFEFLNQNTALLTLKTFEDQPDLKFRVFIDSIFQDLTDKKASTLIIDLRMNSGGPSANATYLYSWLTDKLFRFVHSLEVTPAGLARLDRNPLKFTKNSAGNMVTSDSAYTAVPALFGLGL